MPLAPERFDDIAEPPFSPSGNPAKVPASLREIVENNEGVVLTSHLGDPGAASYITGQMAELKSAGVTRLFIQDLNNNPEKQAWIAAFNNGDDRFRGEIERSFDRSLSSTDNKKVYDILNAARRNGIEIVSVGTKEPHSMIPWKANNEAAKLQIQARALADKSGEKFVVITGKFNTDYASRSSQELDGDQATGLDKLLGVPCVRVTGHPKNPARMAHLEASSDNNTYILVPPVEATKGHSIV